MVEEIRKAGSIAIVLSAFLRFIHIIKDALLRAGTPIEDMDILIGAHARACSFTLVTDNQKHMNRIDGLKIENWIDRE